MSEITKSIQFICDEKGLKMDEVMEAVQTALGAAYRKDFGNRQGNYKVKFDPETGDMQVWDVKEIVEDIDEDILEKAQEQMAELREKARAEERELTEEEIEGIPQFNPKTQIMLADAKEIKENAKVGEILEIDQEVPGDFGRMAAQTAKQVIIQKLREAERNTVFDEFKDMVGETVQGVVQRRDRSGGVIIDLGKITGILPQGEQVRRDQYRPGNRLRFYIVSVEMGTRGPQIILSRSSNEMITSIFNQEIPEIADNSVEIKAIARDPGNRSKVAVWTADETIDPIGACIGQRGSRITTIIEELGGEKIDVIQWTDDEEEFIKNALSPAKVTSVDLDKKAKEATAHVAEDQFSLAIGRGGVNVRLAAELTGWTIKVLQEGGVEVSSEEEEEDVEKKLSEESVDDKESKSNDKKEIKDIKDNEETKEDEKEKKQD